MSSDPVYGTFHDEIHLTRRRTSRKTVAAVFGSIILLAIASVVHITVVYNDSELLSVPAAQPTPALKNALASSPDVKEFIDFLPLQMASMINREVDPCEDFHEWACGKFEELTKIPADKSSFAYSWDGDAKTITTELRRMMEADTGSVGDYYAACMNTELVEARGTLPVIPHLALIDSINDLDTLAIAVAQLHLIEVGNFFDWYLQTDDTDPSRVVLMIDQGGIDLPDSSYYSSSDPRNKLHVQVYRDYLTKLYELYGIPAGEAVVMMEDTLAVESLLASHATDDNDLNTAPKYSLSQLENEFPNFKWRAYFASLGHSDIATNFDQIWLTSPKWLKAMDTLVSVAPLSRLKTYMKSHLMFNVSPLLGDSFFSINLKVDNDLYGVTQHPDRWEKCVGATRAAVPFKVARMFVEKYFPTTAREIATTMLGHIRDAFSRDLSTISWMSAASRAAAQDKLARIFFEVGYPSVWPEYHFEVTRTTYFENSLRSSKWRTTDKFERLRHPTDTHRWTMSPVAANAYYDSGVNGVFVPAGLLQPPFFDWKQPLAHNYGSSGAIMAHELTHGFDNSGRKYDGYGRKREWWDANTVKEFEERASCIANLYNDYKIAGSHVSGNSTLGENIADIGGVKSAYSAYLSEEQKASKAPPDSNHRRLFWTSFAQTWCSVDRQRVLKLNLLTDVHSPDKFRIIGPLSENADFAKDFQCPVGSKMNPAQRCQLW